MTAMRRDQLEDFMHATPALHLTLSSSGKLAAVCRWRPAALAILHSRQRQAVRKQLLPILKAAAALMRWFPRQEVRLRDGLDGALMLPLSVLEVHGGSVVGIWESMRRCSPSSSSQDGFPWSGGSSAESATAYEARHLAVLHSIVARLEEGAGARLKLSLGDVMAAYTSAFSVQTRAEGAAFLYEDYVPRLLEAVTLRQGADEQLERVICRQIFRPLEKFADIRGRAPLRALWEAAVSRALKVSP